MDYSRSYSSACHCYRVDPASWRDIEEIDVVEAKVSATEDALMQSADVTITEAVGEMWLRIYLEARQTGDAEMIPVFTGLTSAPEETIKGNNHEYAADCYSVLKPAADVHLLRGWYAPTGVSAASIARDLLSVCPAPIEVDTDAPSLEKTVVAEDGESRLDMAEKILKAINWRIRLTGDGVIHLIPKSIEPLITFDNLAHDTIEPPVKLKRDWFSCPNVLIASDGETSAIARDDDPDSPLSTVSRGREIWEEDTDLALKTGETLAEYALRKLKAAQSVATTVSYNRRFEPDVLCGDTIRIHYPEVEGKFTITSQSIDCRRWTVDEEAKEAKAIVSE